ncbi:MAG: hypothetical protein SPI86_03800 [Treponemataceae bacterium]|nr:hypothetical protein [Spirochaetales bacterium]MDY6030871.1 hypothetical protein [Treponemataceae bacterium]
MQNPFQTGEKTKSIAEHISIIREYQQRGLLDRTKALEVYKKFNFEHVDYCTLMNATAAATNSSIQIDSARDQILVDNLKRQALWAVGGRIS